MGKEALFTLLTFLAAVLLGGGTVAAEQTAPTSSASILQQVEFLESQVAYAEPACGACDVSCGCRCGGGGGGAGGGGGGRVTALAEMMFLRFFEADGVSDNQSNDTDRFDFDVAPRITLGYTTWDGLSARVRFFDYNHSAFIDGDTFSVETYNVDFELAQELRVGRVTRLEFMGGFRYNHYEHRESGNSEPDEEFSGVGLFGGFEVKRDWSCGNFYGRVRQAILVGDSREIGSSTFRGDSVLGQLELSVGYEFLRQLSRGCDLSLRGGLETQQWFGYEDDQEDVGFSGFLLSAGLNY